MKTITFEQLAEKLNGKLWVKGDLKRIYLDEGYNTKKMSTKTYVYVDKNGDYKVSCNIDCPSQSYQWIESQEEKVVEEVTTRIENIISQLNLELIDYKINEEEGTADVLVKENSDAEPKWYEEMKFYSKFGDYAEKVFGGKLQEELNIVYAKNKEKALAEAKSKEADKPVESNEQKSKVYELGNGKKVRHARFGLGEIIEETEDNVKVLFQTEGEKSLLKKFAPLTYINE
jgi:hypothetical protein